MLLLVMGSAACGGAGTVITRLAVGDPGPDAYTIVSGTDDEDVGRLAAAGGDKKGDEPGLYGGTRQDAVCDKDALVKFLEGDPDKAKVWASAQGISPDGIAKFVAGLTPVLLRADTLVTNHGYRDGKATKMPAVLQAGIAVMVNARGLPVVKCNCGNPLSEPEVDPKESDFKGASWPQFSPEKVTVVSPPERDVEDLKLVDADTGTAFDRPVGTEGEADGRPEPVPPTAASEPPSAPASPGDPAKTAPTTPLTPPTDLPTPTTPPDEPSDAPPTEAPEPPAQTPDDPPPAADPPPTTPDDPPAPETPPQPDADPPPPADPPAATPEKQTPQSLRDCGKGTSPTLPCG
ncbi:DUF6777 domain-containing protein [Actinocorallia sp. A-T 12471]|uniref:DUF6777 domain-containing protein n=1 Tax=Actinocorallia sp. A-T 12471 TaxID=3089813 RepID=UPI0029CB3DE0|nr:DUF6777 domain-containing protein [Actinocorallia sp. A-T 12471]MDX6739403.1 DUF6777 domain-containing protein [Actinocorallia sp. A-T 12471]